MVHTRSLLDQFWGPYQNRFYWSVTKRTFQTLSSWSLCSGKGKLQHQYSFFQLNFSPYKNFCLQWNVKQESPISSGCQLLNKPFFLTLVLVSGVFTLKAAKTKFGINTVVLFIFWRLIKVKLITQNKNATNLEII